MNRHKRLTNEQYEFIKREIVYIFEKYEIHCIPISGFELASKIGIHMIPYSSLTRKQLESACELSNDGFYLETKSGRDYIYYNDRIAYVRMNMTILHEIGHCVLDHDGQSDNEEAEANFFAKYAIAPPPLVDKIKPECPIDIANVFHISYEASIYALDYYKKWLVYGNKDYTEYEMRLLNLFKAS